MSTLLLSALLAAPALADDVPERSTFVTGARAEAARRAFEDGVSVGGTTWRSKWLEATPGSRDALSKAVQLTPGGWLAPTTGTPRLPGGAISVYVDGTRVSMEDYPAGGWAPGR